MTGVLVEISPNKAGFQPKLRLDKGFGDAVAEYCRRRWPVHTAKMAAREFDLSLDEGKACAKGTPSKTTIEKLFKRGGLLVALQIVEEVTGERIAQHLHHLETAHERHTERLAALVGGRSPVPRTWPDDPASLDLRETDRREPVRRRVG